MHRIDVHRVRIRPARAFVLTAVALAVVLPLAAAGAVLVLVDWGWLLVAGVVLIGAAAGVLAGAGEDERWYGRSSPAGEALLQRLCIRADVAVPELVVEYAAEANAWTAGGRVHVTDTLLELLDARELQAVLAHEVAHLARRDAVAMEICSAPSRVLLGFAGLVSPRLARWTWGVIGHGAPPLIAIAMCVLALLCVPPAFAVGWISRLSALGVSRARELSADAAAARLSGSPSALASALLKLDSQREGIPRRDLRQAEMLCIAGASSRLGRLLSTHPPTAVRVRRLAALEARMQVGPFRGRLRRRYV